MNTTRSSTERALTAALLAISLLALTTAAPTALLQSALDPNPALHSYTAAATLTAELHALVPVRKTFTGTVYYLKPKQSIVFENVTGPLSQFRELASALPSYDELTTDYAITRASDDGTNSTYVLMPSTSGHRVKYLTLTIGDRQALLARAVWTYTDGSSMSIEPTYAQFDTFRLPTTEQISAHFPAYSVNGTLRLTDYHLGAPVNASVFTAH